MTEEKRKRGRPKGSGKKKMVIEAGQLPESEIIQIAETAKNYTPSRLEAIAEVMEDVFLAKRKIDQFKQKPAAPERPYPSNWNELGKIAKLQWLTENKSK